LGASQRSTELLHLEEDDERSGIQAGLRELGCWAGLMGYGQVSPFSLFFLIQFFFLFLISSFEISD
jgi:hypothetical protein